MYLCKRMTESSLPEIGRRFGGKHHSTVIHAIQKIEKKRSNEKEFDRLVDSFRPTAALRSALFHKAGWSAPCGKLEADCADRESADETSRRTTAARRSIHRVRAACGHGFERNPQIRISYHHYC